MAAIDKLYLHSYEELAEFRTWLIIYYPKALQYCYNNWMMDYDSYKKRLDNWINDGINASEKEYKWLGDFKKFREAIVNLQKYYKDNHGYDCPYDQAFDEANTLIKHHLMTEEDWKEEYSFPIMSAPFKVDKKLKWICPLPFVRDYLHKQCGVNPKWEWLYRIFWRGKEFI